MKALKCFLVLFTFVGLMLVGCSDQSQSPVSPPDQASLQKWATWDFTGTNIPIGTTKEPIMKNPDNKLLMLKFEGPTLFTKLTGDGPDNLSGLGEIEISGRTDFSTMTGQWRGKLVLTPNGVSDGLWQLTWHGPSVYSETAYYGAPGWILSLQMVGHGEGGGLTGMQIRTDATVHCLLDFSNWYADFTGVMTSH